MILQGEAIASKNAVVGKLIFLNEMEDLAKIKQNDIVVLSSQLSKGDGLYIMYNAIKNGAIGIVKEGGRIDHGTIAAKELDVNVIRVTDCSKLKSFIGKEVCLQDGAIKEGRAVIKEKKEIDFSVKCKPKVKINLGFMEVMGKYPKLAEVADGVAFARLEFILLKILNGKHPLKYVEEFGEEDLAEQIYNSIKPLVRAFAKEKKEVWFRTDDLSSDLLINLEGGRDYEVNESNPYSGYRGIRRVGKQPELIIPQFKAIKKLLDEGYTNIGLFPPMTSFYSEYKLWKGLALKEGLKNIKFGLMVETPAAALTIEEFANEIEFVVFGTNDLTQFTLGVDRTNPKTLELFDESEEAVLKLMRMVITCCKNNNIETTIGGEAGSNKKLLDNLFNYRLSGTSVSPNYESVIKMRTYLQ